MPPAQTSSGEFTWPRGVHELPLHQYGSNCWLRLIRPIVLNSLEASRPSKTRLTYLFYVRYKEIGIKLALFLTVLLILNDLLALFRVFDYFAFPVSMLA